MQEVQRGSSERIPGEKGITMTFRCGYEIRPASWHIDPEPAELCENEVENDGDVCTEHETD
jgi:hypothetical protein